MNKIKVIDLLNMISKGEEVPKKVKYKTFYWEYSEKNRDYKDTYEDYVFSCSNYDIPEMLNNEVEIIEEDKKIEKIDCKDFEFMKKPDKVRFLAKKINEIIDKINKMEDK